MALINKDIQTILDEQMKDKTTDEKVNLLKTPLVKWLIECQKPYDEPDLSTMTEEDKISAKQYLPVVLQTKHEFFIKNGVPFEWWGFDLRFVGYVKVNTFLLKN